ncbi:trypsin-like serine peptidase [Flavilitoribacter nigricans]|uniref:Serine protease n=1 Tax=Flavilitoribacter nigricans (strain ATCC 23147 / DSM 23189 / NBRC 102662 / NCIMB 1420 / SS-2) TaxID=1122177 RepID=A0A2D0MXR9_FLAN2|nr:serine protease [Flavilitoribacter nigricans]PHN00699.1 hypothetical protein CRP01_40820 [Flavilitoribacter nigricans DSM 23189 = NBRC 102662]
MRDLLKLLDKAESDFATDQEQFKQKAEQIKKVTSPQELADLTGSDALRSKIAELNGDPIDLERILGKNNLMDVYYFRKGLEVARTVCRLVYWPSFQSEKQASGTGFLIGPGLLMTNNHVIPNVIRAQNLYAEFEYEKLDGININTQTPVFKLDPESFFITSKALDYAIIAVEPTACNHPDCQLEAYGWNSLRPAKDKIFDGQFLTIIQHPLGQQKMIAFRENQLIEAQGNFLHYTTDTDRGSSGSLVANDDWEIIGLHRSGVPEKNDKGEILLTKGGIWQSSQDNAFIKWIANQGVFVDCILEDVAGREVPVRQELIKGQLLNAK